MQGFTMVPKLTVSPAAMLAAMPKALRIRLAGKPISLDAVAVAPKIPHVFEV